MRKENRDLVPVGFSNEVKRFSKCLSSYPFQRQHLAWQETFWGAGLSLLFCIALYHSPVDSCRWSLSIAIAKSWRLSDVPNEELSNSLSTLERMGEKRKVSVQKPCLGVMSCLEFVWDCSHHACIHDTHIYVYISFSTHVAIPVHGQMHKSQMELDGISSCWHYWGECVAGLDL